MNKKYSELSDAELIKEFQDNDTVEAYETLVKKYRDPLMNFVFRFVGNRDVATDIVQDTMIKFYIHKNSYQSFAKFSTWIYTIAGNLARNELKRRKRRSILSLTTSKDEMELQIEDKTYWAPDKVTDSKLKNKLIESALSKIKDIYREVVVLRDIQDLSYDEVAEITGLSLGTVKSRINRGRSQLQKLLKNIYNE